MKKTPGLMTSHPPPLNRENFRAMALTFEMAEMRDEIERLRTNLTQIHAVFKWSVNLTTIVSNRVNSNLATTCERLWAYLVTTRSGSARSRWSWRTVLSRVILTALLQLKSLQLRWESCEFKPVTGSLVTLVRSLKTAWICVRFVRGFVYYKS